MSLCTVHNTDCKTEKSFSVSITSRRKLGVISATCPAILSAFTQSLFSTALPSLTLWLVYLHNKEVNVSVEYVSVTFQQEIFTGHGNTLSLTSLNKGQACPVSGGVFKVLCSQEKPFQQQQCQQRDTTRKSSYLHKRHPCVRFSTCDISQIYAEGPGWHDWSFLLLSVDFLKISKNLVIQVLQDSDQEIQHHHMQTNRGPCWTTYREFFSFSITHTCSIFYGPLDWIQYNLF